MQTKHFTYMTSHYKVLYKFTFFTQAADTLRITVKAAEAQNEDGSKTRTYHDVSASKVAATVAAPTCVSL